MLAPDNDASTGSLETQSGPTESLYKKQKALYNQTKLVLRIDGFMHEAIFLNATPYQLSWFCTVPNVCPSGTHSRSHCTPCKQVRLCRVVSGSADKTMIAYV
ncbi:hypothetical protein NIES2130_20345 [Scytonema sp. HK-05]|nr:hypothetical protein NIES2130_20345 [Scytonema sp. HK-05]